jgi:hypothetical protein
MLFFDQLVKLLFVNMLLTTYVLCFIFREVIWTVGLHDDFVPEYNDLPEAVQDELLAKMGLLERIGP